MQGDANAMEVAGQHLYLVSSNLVEVFDLSDPKQPVAIGSAATKGHGLDLAVDGSYIYVADGSWGLQIFRVEPAVQLEADLTGSELRLKWPESASKYVLQGAENLAGAEWGPVAGTPQLQGGFFRLAVSVEGATAFFRLHQP